MRIVVRLSLLAAVVALTNKAVAQDDDRIAFWDWCSGGVGRARRLGRGSLR